GGGLQAVGFAGLHCHHVFYQRIVGREQEVIALTNNGGPQRHRHRQGDRHHAHPQVPFVSAHDLRVCLKSAVEPVEQGVVFYLDEDHQSRFRNFERFATRKGDNDFVGLVQREKRAASTAQRTEQFVTFLPGG